MSTVRRKRITVNSRLADTSLKYGQQLNPRQKHYRRLTEINSRYYELSLMRALTRGPYGVRNKGS